nr:mitoguardin [Leptinotarsa decemlineata]
MSIIINLGHLKEYVQTVRQFLPQKPTLSTTQKVVLSRFFLDVGSVASSGRRSATYSDKYNRQGSIISGKASIASGSIVSSGLPIPEGLETTNLTPQQLGVMGMEALETCISYWEDALAAYRNKDGAGPLAVLGPEEAGFCRDLQQLLEFALELQENSEMLFLDERSILFKADRSTRSNGALDVDLSGGESFASAQDMVADLREFEEFAEYFPDLESLPLYQAALRQLESGGIPCRTLRTELVKCGSDGEYLAKLHCLRLAFQHLLRDQLNYIFFVDAGRQILADLLLYADKDPKDFLIGYEEMIRFIQDPKNWRDLEDELSSKGVKALSFYDIVCDYILMDAFDDLEHPPSSVTAVIQNRWLSKGFKETALTTAVWSVLKAKRRRLRFPEGFMAHFYTLSEQLSPLLAWGFLGSDELLRDTCVYFKEQVMEFLADIFSFSKCKYTSIEELAHDVLGNMRTRVDNICLRLSVQS